MVFFVVWAAACGSAEADVKLSASVSAAPPAATPSMAPPPPAASTLSVATGTQPEAVLEGDRIRIAKTILYEVDKDQIKPESFPILDAVANILAGHPEIVQLTVEGHTDNQGSFEHNKKLSERRANAVVRYLAQKGVKQQLLAPGYGATAPVCHTDDETCRQRNRRVEFKVKTQ